MGVEWSYDSWVKDFEMECRGSHVEWMTTLSIVANCLSCLIISFVGDLFGRRIGLIVSSIVYIFSYVMINYLQGFESKLVFFGFACGNNEVLMSLYGIIVNETERNFFFYKDFYSRNRAQIFTINSISFGMGGIILGILTFYVSTTEDLVYIGACCLCVGLFGNLFLKETPAWLYEKGRVSDLHENLSQLARINKVTTEEGEESVEKKIGLEEYNFKNEKYNLESGESSTKEIKSAFLNLGIMFHEKYRMQTVAFFAISLTMYYIFFGVEIAVSQLGIETIQLNQLLSAATNILGCMLAIPLVARTPRKTANYYCLTLFSIFGILLAFFSEEMQASKWSRTLQSIICTVGINSLVSFQFIVLPIHVTETYPTEIRTMALGIILTFGKLGSAFSSFLIEYSRSLGLNPVTLCCLPALLAIPLVPYLKETYNKEGNLENKGSDIEGSVSDEDSSLITKHSKIN